MGEKICLTITDYHPDQWNPSWTIRLMLKAIISQFPIKEKILGVGSLHTKIKDCKKLALKSQSFKCP